MSNKKIIINIQVFNSFKNLPKIFKNIKKSKLNITNIILIDNNSTMKLSEKIKMIKELKVKYKIKIKIKFIVNKMNYGYGGSQKILFNLLKKETFDYVLNLGTSNRYNIKSVLRDVKKNLNTSKEYYLFSRFINKKSTRDYNKVRRDFNIVFILITKIFTQTFFSDPGQTTYLMKSKLLKNLNKIKVQNITNGSHFGHFLNIKLYRLGLDYKEIPLTWKEGNVKSHLKPLSYVIIFSFSILRYFFTREFIIEKNNKFKFDSYIF